MRTAEEILPFSENYEEGQGYWSSGGGKIVDYEDAIKAINKARKETIEECAEIATVTIEHDYDRMDNLKPKSVVNKHSILQLINELQ